MTFEALDEPRKPLPRLDGPERLFWEGLREGQDQGPALPVLRPTAFPASRYCPKCHAPE
jgi:uncharacterized protein